MLLEGGFHVISNLSDCMADCVSNHWVLVWKHCHDNFNDRIDFRDFLDVLSNLG